MRQAGARRMPGRTSRPAVAATITPPAAFQPGAGAENIGQQAIAARTNPAAADLGADILVSIPQAAATIAAAAPAQNHTTPWSTGLTDIDARMTARAAVSVSRTLTACLPGRSGPAARLRGWHAG